MVHMNVPSENGEFCTR